MVFTVAEGGRQFYKILVRLKITGREERRENSEKTWKVEETEERERSGGELGD